MSTVVPSQSNEEGFWLASATSVAGTLSTTGSSTNEVLADNADLAALRVRIVGVASLEDGDADGDLRLLRAV